MGDDQVVEWPNGNVSQKVRICFPNGLPKAMRRSERSVPLDVTSGDLNHVKNDVTKRQGHSILTNNQARVIFKYKPSPLAKDRGRASALAQYFGVSVKTIRDIWIGRTWCRATFDLNSGKQAPSNVYKKLGRPLGSKDSKPRSKPGRDSVPHDNSPPQSISQDQILDDRVQLNDLTLEFGPKILEALTKESSGTCQRQINDCPKEFAQWLSKPVGSSSCDPFYDDWPFWKGMNSDLRPM
mmetsp:Transcript_63529/g.169987  ORF Transcript_63529/g.169987 Transcript_63529/m.169987 type:complete len:239 (-) Transcript_63529:76-792(-)